MLLTIQRALLPPPHYTENILALGVALPIAAYAIFQPVMPCPCITPEPLGFRFGFVAYLFLHIAMRLFAADRRINAMRYCIACIHATFLTAVTAYRVETIGWAGIWIPAATGLVLMEFWIIARLASGFHSEDRQCGN